MCQAAIKSLRATADFAGPSTPQIQLGIDYLVKHKNGHERLIPNRVTFFIYLGVPVSCDQGNWFASGSAFDLGVPGIKITKKRFSYTYTRLPDPYGLHSTVQLTGQKMWQGTTKWRSPSKKPKPPGRKFFSKMASGVLSIIDWGDLGTGHSNCTSNGPKSWSVHQCRDGSGPVYLPLCSQQF